MSMIKARRHAIRVLSEFIDLSKDKAAGSVYDRYRSLVDRFPEPLLMK